MAAPRHFSQTEGAQELVKAVKEGKPYAAGKLGTSEFELLMHLTSVHSEVPKIVVQNIAVNAGLFPHTPESLHAWAETMKTSVLPTMDLMVEWNAMGAAARAEHKFLNAYAPYSNRTVLRALEPYYESDPAHQYSRQMKGKVAVVCPFAESVAAQVSKLLEVWPQQIWTPAAEFVPIKTGYNPVFGGTGWPAHVKKWQDAVAHVVEKVRECGAKYALVGCGALSLPICAALKRAGLVAIHTGGATQILFGIQGRRWDSHSIISKFYNDAWIRPSAAEIPHFSKHIEGGCYW